MLFVLLILSLGLSPQIAAQADLCADQVPGSSIAAVVITHARQIGDTLVTATVCIVPARSSDKKIGSYHGELHFDSMAVTVARVQKPEEGGGLRVENATLNGQVNFAGAAPSGFAGRALVTVVLKLRNAHARPRLRLEMKELNATDGTSLIEQIAPGRPR